MHTLLTIKERKFFYIPLCIFALLFASITFVNHYFFRTYAFDLGINNNAIYDYAHFRWNDCMVMQPQFDNVLSDHFSLLPILFSPLYWLFGSYTMLVVQWAGVLFGGAGIYTFFKRKTENPYIPMLAMVHFFSIWGVYSALAFDYHDNVMAAMFVPWFINYFDRQRWFLAGLFFTLILVSKENMALWMVFLAPGLGLLYWKTNRKLLLTGIALGLVAAVYFAFVVKVVIPSLANADREYLHFRYEAIGENFSEALATIITRPWYAFKLLFTNHLDEPYLDGIKEELLWMVLFSGGLALFFKPQYLIMLLPVFAQKLYSDDYLKWGINFQYSIEFVPILTLALFTMLLQLRNKKWAVATAIVVCAGTMVATGAKMDNRTSLWYVPEPVRFYQEVHYKQDYDVEELYNTLKIIPKDAPVSAQNFVLPHLCARDYIYLFPKIGNAEWVLMVSDEKNYYPLRSIARQNQLMDRYRTDPMWQVVYDKNATLIVRKKK